MKFLWCFLYLLYFFEIQAHEETSQNYSQNYETDLTSNVSESERNGRLFPFMALVRIPSTICMASDNRQGVCKIKKQCEKEGGTISGSNCASGFGVCCILTTSCSARNNGRPITIKSSGTHLVQPAAYTSPLQCQFNFPRKSGACQVRLDFVNVMISQPNPLGDCDTDSITVAGADNVQNFVTCGTLTNQHLYLHYGSSESISLNINLDAIGQSYDILVNYLDCDENRPNKTKRKGREYSKSSSSSNNNDDTGFELEAAPSGCSQYYTKSSDTVRSFNYRKITDISINPNQLQINSEQYSVCVKTTSGSKRITWQRCSPDDSFFISGSYPPPDVALPCDTDYIDIPGSPAGRYCGQSFPNNVMSTIKPFMMFVNFDDQEAFGLDLPINPATGCCAGFCTCYINQLPVPPGGPACMPGQPGHQCHADEYLVDRTDFNNVGFCLKYNIS